jgi:two-component system cell cycle response regulator
MELSRDSAGARRLVRGLLAATAVFVVAYAAFVLAGEPTSIEDPMSLWVYHGALLLAAVTCLVRGALVRDQGAAWIAFGVGLVFWTAGDVYWTLALADLRRIPYPSLADLGYLAAVPCFYVGIGLLIKRRIGHFTAASWLDGAIGGLAAAALGTAVLAPALVGLTRGEPAAVLTNLAYPLSDVLLIAFIVGALVVSGFRGATAFLAIAAGLATWTLADCIYLYQEATSSYSGGWLDLLWPIGAMLIAAAAALSFAPQSLERRLYSSPILFPSVCAAIAVGVLTWDHFSRLHEISIWLSVGTLGVVIVRMAISFRENTGLMAALHSDTITDALTELGNRRKLIDDLESSVGWKTTRAASKVFALFDLDGFKFYNDSFGHPAGDSLLRRLGANLVAAVEPDGCAYRLGGDEFCILVDPRGRRTASIVEAARAALTESGEGFRISASVGAVLLPAEAGDGSEALRLADRRMYAEKSRRSDRIEHQTHELLVRILRDRVPDLADHHDGVARLAVAIGRELGLDAEAIDVLRRAAEFHDIGKIAIPDEILDKPGPLDEIEWELMRKHTLVGERILGASPSLVPVARVVRSTHERWDGGGYPDGLEGEEIPLEARIVFLCDAFDAMRSERPYSQSRDRQSTLEELRSNSGTQFDPGLVELFCSRVEPEDPAVAATGSERSSLERS